MLPSNATQARRATPRCLFFTLGALAALAGCTHRAPEPGRAHEDGDPYPEAALPPVGTSLQETLAWLAEQAPSMTPGTEIGLAAWDLTSGERASWAGDRPFVSASVGKPMWVAAALRHGRVEEVAELAPPIFERSDNEAAGRAIDLVGPSPEGPNLVNEMLWNEVGMTHTALIDWSDERRVRLSTNAPVEMGDESYATADDLVLFLEAVASGRLLGRERSARLERWMTTSPREGFGGWLGTELPAAARATMEHKAGWLVPGCCMDVDEADSVLNDMGIVSVPGGHRYAIAILSRHGRDYWTRHAGFVELASCVVYRAVARAPVACEPPESGMSADGSDCGEITEQGYCEGSSLVRCEAGALARRDCAREGLACRWDDGAVGYGCLPREAR